MQIFKQFLDDLTKLGLRQDQSEVSEYGLIYSLYVSLLGKVFILRTEDKHSELVGWTTWLQLCSIDHNGLVIKQEEQVFDLWSNKGTSADHQRTREIIKNKELRATVLYSVEENEDLHRKMHEKDPHYPHLKSQTDLTKCRVNWVHEGQGGCFLITRRAQTEMRKIHYPANWPPLAPGYGFSSHPLKEERVEQKIPEDEFTLNNLQRIVDESGVNN